MPNTASVPLSDHNRDQLRKAREKRGWTQFGLTRRMPRKDRVSSVQISRIELGIKNPSLATLQAICAALGLVVDVTTRVVIKKGKP